MAYVKGQPFIPQFIDPATGLLMASGTVEFFLTGTSTPTPYYTSSGGASGGTSLTLNSGGKPATDVFFNTAITYKIVVKNAVGSILDTIDPYNVPSIQDIVLSAAYFQKKFATLALAVASTTIVEQDVLLIADRDNSSWDVVLSSGVTENTFDIVQCTGVATLSLVLRKDNNTVTLKSLGASLNDSTDDYLIINHAFQQAGWNVALGEGAARCSTGLTAPLCAKISGNGLLRSIIHFDAGVTKGLPIKGSVPEVLEDFQLKGNSTASARGLVMGDGALTAFITMNRVWANAWTGTSAIGADFRDCVAITANDCQFSNCTVNKRIKAGTATSGPTTVSFNGGVVELASAEGAILTGGTGITWNNEFVFQTNRKQGLLVQAATGENITNCHLNNVWFEGNQRISAGVYDTAEYQFKVDGAESGTTTTIGFHDSYCNGDVNSAKSIHITGANVRGCVVDNATIPPLTGQILFDGSAQADIINWPSQLLETVATLSNPTLQNSTIGFETAWTAWTPTYASSSGNAATTFTGPGTVTTSLARWKRVGKTLHMAISFGATLNAVTPTYLSFTLPNGYSAANAITYTPAAVLDNATYLGTGVVSTAGTTAIRVYKSLAAPAFTSGSAVECNVSFSIEIV